MEQRALELGAQRLAGAKAERPAADRARRWAESGQPQPRSTKAAVGPGSHSRCGRLSTPTTSESNSRSALLETLPLGRRGTGLRRGVGGCRVLPQSDEGLPVSL